MKIATDERDNFKIRIAEADHGVLQSEAVALLQALAKQQKQTEKFWQAAEELKGALSKVVKTVATDLTRILRRAEEQYEEFEAAQKQIKDLAKQHRAQFVQPMAYVYSAHEHKAYKDYNSAHEQHALLEPRWPHLVYTPGALVYTPSTQENQIKAHAHLGKMRCIIRGRPNITSLVVCERLTVIAALLGQMSNGRPVPGKQTFYKGLSNLHQVHKCVEAIAKTKVDLKQLHRLAEEQVHENTTHAKIWRATTKGIVWRASIPNGKGPHSIKYPDEEVIVEIEYPDGATAPAASDAVKQERDSSKRGNHTGNAEMGHADSSKRGNDTNNVEVQNVNSSKGQERQQEQEELESNMDSLSLGDKRGRRSQSAGERDLRRSRADSENEMEKAQNAKDAEERSKRNRHTNFEPLPSLESDEE